MISNYSIRKQFVGTGILFLLLLVVVVVFVYLFVFLSFYEEKLGKILREENDLMKVVALSF